MSAPNSQGNDATQPRDLAELFASWGPVHILNPHEPRGIQKLASRYADLLQLIHRHEARLSETLPKDGDPYYENGKLIGHYRINPTPNTTDALGYVHFTRRSDCDYCKGQAAACETAPVGKCLMRDDQRNAP